MSWRDSIICRLDNHRISSYLANKNARHAEGEHIASGQIVKSSHNVDLGFAHVLRIAEKRIADVDLVLFPV